MPEKHSKNGYGNSKPLVQSLTFKDWWHLLSRYTSVVESMDTIRTALRIMAHRGFRHLPVVSNGSLIGMVSAGDLIETFAGREEYKTHFIEEKMAHATLTSEMKTSGGRIRSSLNNTISSITNTNPEIIHPNDTILDAITSISERNIGSLIIVEGERGEQSADKEDKIRSSQTALPEKRFNGKLLGIVTLRDLVSILASYSPFGIRVEDCMSERVATISDRDSIVSAMILMSGKKVRRLPVVATPKGRTLGNNPVQGMITNKMILRYLESIISYEMLDLDTALGQPVKTVMQSSMPMIDPKEDCGNAAYLMREIGTGGFAVVDSRGLIGVITERDLIRNIYKKKGIAFFSELFEKGNAQMQI